MSEAFESNYHIAQGENVQGPHTLPQAQKLIEEGKVRADMLFSRDGADWVEGYQLPELFPDALGAPEAPVRRDAENPGLHRGGSRGRGRVEAHRGGAILALGIIGVVLCQICGIIAWVMGNKDLAKMKAGRMDRSGEGMTQAGKILGIISVALMVIGIAWVVFVGAMFGAAGVSSSGM
jgi:hypothetical protein